MSLRTFTFNHPTPPDTGDGPDRFAILWQAFGYMPLPNGRVLNDSKRREEGELARKLKKISEASPDKQTRVLKDGDQTLALLPHEIELLRERIDTCPFWLPGAADLVADTRTWLGMGTETP